MTDVECAHPGCGLPDRLHGAPDRSRVTQSNHWFKAALDVKGGCYFCGATGIAPHAGCRGGNVPLPGDEDIERWYAAFAKVSGLDAKRRPGKRVIWEQFAAEYARLQEQDR